MTEETIPCETCRVLTRAVDNKRCDGCWEIERRLDSYLRRGGTRARIAVVSALIRHDPEIEILFSSRRGPQNPEAMVGIFTIGEEKDP